jgi:hypothetical protein
MNWSLGREVKRRADAFPASQKGNKWEVVMTARYALFHPRIVRALLDLSDPKKAICLPLVKGKAAGKLDLIYQLYPPRNTHRNNIPALYTFVLEDWVTEEISIMVSVVNTDNGGDDLIFGFIAHDYWFAIQEQAGTNTPDAQQLFVAVKYDPTTREGRIYLYKEAYVVIEKARESDLESCRRLKNMDIEFPLLKKRRESRRTLRHA